MSRTVTVVEGDTAQAIVATLSNADGAQDLTGATVMFRAKDPVTGRSITEVEADILSPATAGRVSVPGTERAAWRAGGYVPEYVVTYADSSVDIFPCEDDDDLQAEYRVNVRARAT